MPCCVSKLPGEALVLGNLGLGAEGAVWLRLRPVSFPIVMDFRAPRGMHLKLSDCLKKGLFFSWPRAVVQWPCFEKWDSMGLGSVFLRC